MPSFDPFDIPEWAPMPPPYAVGARAVCAYQARHRGRRFEGIWKKVGDDTLLVHEAITFIPDRAVEMYMPEAGRSARSGCLGLLGGLFALAFIAAELVPSSWIGGLADLPFGVWIAIGVTVLAVVVIGLARADKEHRENAKRGIWVEGVLLFPDALLLRTRIGVDVFAKKDIVRFALRRAAGHDAHVHDTCLVQRGEDGEDVFRRVIALHNSTALLEDWLRGANTPR